MSIRIPKKPKEELTPAQKQQAAAPFKPGTEHILPSGRTYKVDRTGAWRRQQPK